MKSMSRSLIAVLAAAGAGVVAAAQAGETSAQIRALQRIGTGTHDRFRRGNNMPAIRAARKARNVKRHRAHMKGS